MAETLTIGAPPLEIIVRRTSQARRMTLRVSPSRSTPVLTLPPRVSLRAAKEFALAKESWLRGALLRMPTAIELKYGASLCVAGEQITLVQGQGRKVVRSGAELHLPGPNTAAQLRAWLRTQARDRITAAADRYAAQLGQSVSAITLRDPRSRWGSCTSDGRLMLSWRLILAPAEVLDYVVAHEVAHLAEMNHSPAFWHHVEQLCPDYKIHRSWLRAHGAGLHAYQF